MPLAVLAFLSWGFGFGSVTPLNEFMWAGYFGRRHLGAVRSAAAPVTVVVIALAPLLVALWFDGAGSYDGAFLIMTAVYGLAAAVILVMPEPVRSAPTPPLSGEQLAHAGGSPAHASGESDGVAARSP